MQFTLRQLLLCVSAFALWFGLMAEGHYLFGSYGLIVFGSLFGLSIFFLVRMVVRWSRWSFGERVACIVVVLLSLWGGGLLTSSGLNAGYRHVQERVREARQLQAALHTDSRYKSVLVTYERPFCGRGEWLWVRGSVPDQEALDSLHQRIDEGNRLVKWEVDVIPK